MLKLTKYYFLKLFAYTFGQIIYDKKYYKGRYFQKYSIGWSWVFKCFFSQAILGKNKNIPWPVSKNVYLTNSNIHFDVNDLHIFHTFGTYFQTVAGGKIIIGKGTYIAPNVGLITSNHNVNCLEAHTPAKNIEIGDNCWIGMNAVLLPGVRIGNNTIVGAGSIVTKNFINGKCIIAGNPAHIIKNLC